MALSLGVSAGVLEQLRRKSPSRKRQRMPQIARAAKMQAAYASAVSQFGCANDKPTVCLKLATEFLLSDFAASENVIPANRSVCSWDTDGTRRNRSW
jgi:hypothetical protein